MISLQPAQQLVQLSTATRSHDWGEPPMLLQQQHRFLRTEANCEASIKTHHFLNLQLEAGSHSLSAAYQAHPARDHFTT